MIIEFEAKGIQSWISDGGKLKDLSGGSEILELLVDASREDSGLLFRTMKKAGIDRSALLLNAASRIQIEWDDAEHCIVFCQFWTLVVRALAPGLRYKLVVFSEEPEKGDAPTKSRETERIVVQDYSELDDEPMFGPLVQRSPRTGRVACAVDKNDQEDLLDNSTSARRYFGNKVTAENAGVETRLLSKLACFKERYDLIAEADDLSENEARRALAYVHADVSGLGSVYKHIKHDKVLARAFSSNLDEAVRRCVDEALEVCRAAEEEHSEAKKLQLRPVLVGGDDVTLILHARHGFLFAYEFMARFHKASQPICLQLQEALGDKPDIGLPKSLGVGCGIAFATPHYPAAAALHLSEELCDFAKNRVGRSTSALMFHRVLGSALVEDYRDELGASLSFPSTSESYSQTRLTCGPYLLEKPKAPEELNHGGKSITKCQLGLASELLKGYMTITELSELTHAISDPAISRGPVRAFLEPSGSDIAILDDKLQRIREVAKDGGIVAEIDAVEHLLAILQRVGPAHGRRSVWQSRAEIDVDPQDTGKYRVPARTVLANPMRDVNTLIGVSHRPGKVAELLLPSLSEKNT